MHVGQPDDCEAKTEHHLKIAADDELYFELTRSPDLPGTQTLQKGQAQCTVEMACLKYEYFMVIRLRPK